MRWDRVKGVDDRQEVVCELSNAELSCYQTVGLVMQAGAHQEKGYYKGPRKSTVMSATQAFGAHLIG